MPPPPTPIRRRSRDPAPPPSNTPIQPVIKSQASEMAEQFQKRERCARILGSYEMLVWYSRQYRESLPQTRLRFQKEMIGLDPDDPEGVVWEDVGEEGAGRKGEREKDKVHEKEKDREGEEKGKGKRKDGEKS